jgi:AmpD protein
MDVKYKAKHAGVSKKNAIRNWNTFSIGVCLQGTDWMSYTNKQYASLKKLVEYINVRYPDSKTKPILGHQDIAFPAGRKKDPGEHFELWRIYNDTALNTRG